jgi:hypothetical protein
MMFIKAPSNLGILQGVTVLIVTYEIVPGELYSDYIWSWTEEEDLEQRYQATGMDSQIFMLSMGMPLYVFTLTLVALILVIITSVCFKNPETGQAEGGEEIEVVESKEKKETCLHKCDKAHTKYKQSLMWNFFLMFFYEACLEITISIAVGLDYVWQ